MNNREPLKIHFPGESLRRVLAYSSSIYAICLVIRCAASCASSRKSKFLEVPSIRLLVCAALICLGAPANAEEFFGKVIAVMDGDTLLVIRDGHPVKVRLAGIDAPEKAQPYGIASQQSLAELVKGKQVQVASRAMDDYGRLIATVHAGEINVNHEQVRRGAAWEYSRYRPRHVTNTTTSHSTRRANNTRQVAGYGEASRLRERAEDGIPAPAGCAPPCRAVNSNRELMALQREAQQAGRGLWAGEGAVEPSQWRKQHPGTFVARPAGAVSAVAPASPDPAH